MSSILELRGFGLAFGERKILESVDLTVPAHGVTVLLGPSGTGKSALLRTLAGFNDASPSLRLRGEARYAGQALTGATARPALVMQKARLMVSSVQENLLADLPDRALLTRLQQLDRVAEFCLRLGQAWVLERLGAEVVALATHEQRAIAVIREALARPELLMLDEPTANLDDAGAARLVELIRDLSAQQPILLVSHNLREARALGQRIALMAGGYMQEQATADAFFAGPASAAGRTFLKTGSCPEQPLPPDAPAGAGAASADGADAAGAAGHVVAAAPDLATAGATGARGLPPAPGAGAPTYSAAVAAKSRYMGPRGFVWLIPGKVAGTPWPGIMRDMSEDLALLRDVGVTRLVSLTEIPFPPEPAAAYGIACHGFAVPDMQAPPARDALALCQRMDQWILEGEVIALHCRAGLGRTGTLLAAYWLWCGKGSRSALQAIEHVRRLESAMIQSQPQVDFLTGFDLCVKTIEKDSNTAVLQQGRRNDPHH